jgi:hypothetical protein
MKDSALNMSALSPDFQSIYVNSIKHIEERERLTHHYSQLFDTFPELAEADKEGVSKKFRNSSITEILEMQDIVIINHYMYSLNNKVTGPRGHVFRAMFLQQFFEGSTERNGLLARFSTYILRLTSYIQSGSTKSRLTGTGSPWSAAFISFVTYDWSSAAAPKKNSSQSFYPSNAHAAYFNRMFSNKEPRNVSLTPSVIPDTVFIPSKDETANYDIKVGDILLNTYPSKSVIIKKGRRIPLTVDKQSASTHGDIVVGVIKNASGRITGFQTIGGNIADAIKLRTVTAHRLTNDFKHASKGFDSGSVQSTYFGIIKLLPVWEL